MNLYLDHETNLDWKVNVHLKGITPLLIHNGRTASPLDEYAQKMKQITSKRNKTEKDLKKLMDIQWEAALYWDDEMGLYMPVENLLAALWKGAKKHKLGPKVSGFFFEEAIGFPILTDHHKKLESLRADPRNKFTKMVTIQRSKVLSCRPIFKTWELKFEFLLDEEILTMEEAKMVLTAMAARIGLGVWTPSNAKPGRMGRFLIKELCFTNQESGEVKKYGTDEI